jgi:HSP20 family protein
MTSLTRWSKENPVASLQKEMDRLFSSFYEDFPVMRRGNGDLWKYEEAFTPRINVAETEKEIQITAELPGMDEKDIHVTLEEDALRIKGEKKEEKEEKGKDYHRVECSYGSFERVIPLPAEVLQDKVDAIFKKGILTVKLPKNPKAQEKCKHIDIKS